MAYMVVAHVAMACIVMTFVIIACMVTSCKAMACVVMAYMRRKVYDATHLIPQLISKGWMPKAAHI